MILDSPIITGSLIQQAGQTAEIPRYTAVSSSFLAASASINQRLNDLSTDSGSQALRLNSLEAKSASVDTTLSGLNTFTQSFSSSVATSISSSNANISALSASVSTVTGDFSSSVATSFSASAASTAVLSASIDTRLDVIESSFATTGSNTFKGTQIVSGSLYVTQDLIVQGSSSLQNITGSSVNIGTNRVILNTDTPAVRFGGISVQDSGSTGETGSLWWDSINNHWIYENPVGETYNSAILIAGPKNTGSLGEETGLTSGYIPVASGEDHISDSIVTQTGGNKITINGTLEVTGPISASNGIVSSSAQLTASYDSRYVLSGSITQTTWDNIANKPGGIVSGSEQTTASLDLRYRQVGTPITFAELDSKPALISGSSQFVTLTDPFTGSFTGSFKGDGSLLGGLTAGGKIHTQSTAAATWVFNHNLNVQYPNVTVYNSVGQIVLPQSITANDSNRLTLEFGTEVAGYAVAGIGGIIEVQGRTVKQQFTASVSWRFEHNLGDRFVNVQVYDQNYEKVIPENIVLTDTTSSLITFPSASAGWAIGTIGGDLPAISSSYAGYTLQISNGAPYTASWVAVPNVTVTNALTASYLNPISQSLIPAVSGAYDLGSVSKPWRHIYVGSGSIYLVDNTGNVTKTLTGDSIVTNDNLSSLNAFTASNFTTNTFTSSTNARLNSIEIVSASNISRISALETHSASVDTTNTTQNARLSSLESVTSSYAISSSVASVDAGQNNRLNSIEAATGSYAKLSGGNTFTGTQVITGSLYVTTDLIVQGSSSLQNITGSAVNIGTNTVILNTANPAVRFGGISVIDSGSTGLTGSILWDSTNNNWLYVNPSGSSYASAKFIAGPKSATLGSELGLITNYIQKAVGDDHISSSAIYDDGTTIGLKSNTEVSGTLKVASYTSSFIGNVGIGTTTPNGKFEIWQAAGNRLVVDYVNIANEPKISSLDSAGNPQYLTLNSYDLKIKANGTEAIRVTELGNVGIGTTNPGEKLTVNGGIGIQRSGAQIWHTGVDASNNLQFVRSGIAERMVITSDGYVGIGTTNPLIKFVVSNAGLTGIELDPSGSTLGGSSINSYNRGAASRSDLEFAGREMQFYTGNPTLGIGIKIKSDGKVGVGTINPTYTLDVQGAQSNIRISSTTGTNSTILRVNNTGGEVYFGRESSTGGDLATSSTAYATVINSQNSYPIQMAVNNAIGLTMTTNGVGIGTTVNGNSKLLVRYSPGGTDPSEAIIAAVLGDNATITTSLFSIKNAGNRGTIGNANGSNLFKAEFSDATAMIITKDGYVGIGVTNPGYSLHVVKDGSAATTSDIVGSSFVSSRTNSQSENIAFRHSSSALGINGNTHAGQIISHGNNSFEIYSTGASAIVFGTSATARIKIDSTGIYPFANNTYNLGTSTYAWANLYTNDLHLNNMNKDGGNDIDGTNGNWTIQEGAENLYIINNNNGKKFKIQLEEIL